MRNKEDRLRLLQRRQKGRRILPEWLRRVGDAIGVAVDKSDVFDLDKTDQLRSLLSDRVRRGGDRKRFFSIAALDDVFVELESLGRETARSPVVLLHSSESCIGGLRVSADTALSHARGLWRVVGEDLQFITEDATSGLCLERNYYGAAGEYVSDGVLELTTWGRFNPKAE